jgi:hypothetical protein
VSEPVPRKPHPPLSHSVGMKRAPRPTTPRLALRKAEVAEALGVSDDFISDHVWHELKLVRRGRLTLAPLAEVERWLDQNAARVFE